MHHFNLSDDEFVARLKEIILQNIGDENFGVEELSKKICIPKRELNNRLLKINTKHVNQFIREIRLEKSLEILINEDITASEVAYMVGFSSPTYFNKCFHEFFGYPPGKIKKTSLTHSGEELINHEINSQEQKRLHGKLFGLNKAGILFLFFVVVIIIILIYPGYLKQYIFEKTKSPDERISVAVMPFQNLTNDSLWNIWEEGIQTNLINSLSNVEEFKVRQIATVNAFLKSNDLNGLASLAPSVVSAISKKLDANVFIQGNINQAGNKIRLNAQIISSKTEETIKSIQIDGRPDLILFMIDSLSVMARNALLVSELKKTGLPAYHEHYLKRVNNPEAYRYFIQGQNALYKNDFSTAIDWFLQAFKIDSTLYGALGKISLAYYNDFNFEQGKIWFQKYYSKLEMMTMTEKIWAKFMHAIYFETPNEKIRYLRQLIEIDDQNPLPYFDLGDIYLETEQYELAIHEFEKALKIFKKWDTKPFWGAFYNELGLAYHAKKLYQEEKKLYKKAEKDFPDTPELIDQYACLALTEGDTSRANRYIEKYISIRREQSWSEARILSNLAFVYYSAGDLEKTEALYRQSLKLEPENPAKMRTLAYLLIDKGINVNEGMELVEKALELQPDNYSDLHVKGWGLYKKGKYQEALEVLRKSWDLRRQKSIYNHAAFVHLEKAKKAVSNR